MATIKNKTDSEKHINLTNIVYDENLHEFVDKAKRDISLENLTSWDINLLMETQEEIREYIRANNSRLTNTSPKNKIANQDYFALLVCMVCDLKGCYNFNDVFKQMSKKAIIDMSNNDDINDIDFDSDDDDTFPQTHCACGHKVFCGNSFIISNHITGLNLLLGCDCIKKHKIFSSKEMAEYRKRIKKQKELRKLEKKRSLLPPTLPPSTLKTQTYLDVEFSEKERVKQLGAWWDAEKKLWYMKGENPQLVKYTLVYLNVPYGAKDIAKGAGAKWDSVGRKWFSNRQNIERTCLKDFLY